MTVTLDRRLHAFRPDLADRRLEGSVSATRFTDGRAARVVAPLAPLRRAPAPDALLETEALAGEAVRVFEADTEGWSWVQLARDGYVGYVPSAALGEAGPAPTHRVRAPRTLVLSGPDIKSAPLGGLPMGAGVTARGEAEDRNARYLLIEPAGAVVAQHLEPMDARAADFVAIAEEFVGAFYLWGGKSAMGIDCTGLVQLSLAMAGIEAPRDSDMQEKALGLGVGPGAALRRGDLVFWRGHVGIMLDAERLLHANAHHMMTAVEPLSQAVERIGGKGVPVSSIKRLDRSAGDGQ